MATLLPLLDANYDNQRRQAAIMQSTVILPTFSVSPFRQRRRPMLWVVSQHDNFVPWPYNAAAGDGVRKSVSQIRAARAIGRLAIWQELLKG